MKKHLLIVVVFALVLTFGLSAQAMALPLPSNPIALPAIVTQPQDQSTTILGTPELSIELSFNDLFGNIEIALYRDATGNGPSGDDTLLVGNAFVDVGTPYTWTVSPSDISGIGTYHYYFKARTLTTSWFYTDDSDYVYSDVATIEVNGLVLVLPMPTPAITTQPADVTMTLGQSTTLTVADAPAVASLLYRSYTASYQWWCRYGTSGFFMLCLGQTSPSITVTPSATGTMQYYCTVTYTDATDSGISNSVNSNTAIVTTVDAPPIVFNDVLTSDWFYDDVYAAVNMGLINGKYVTPPLYVPNGYLTIAEAIKLAACMRQYYETGSVTLVNGSPWYQSYVDYCGDYGIIGYHEYDGKYNNYATRAEYAVIFANALPPSEFAAINNILNGDIPDVTLMDSYGEAVYKLYNAGILQGNDSAGTFAPNTNIKRSEVAAILTRMMDSSARKTFSL